MKIFKQYFKNTFFVLFAEYFYYGVLFLIGILISRSFGGKEFGNYSLVISIAQICILTLGSSFSTILRRDMAIDESIGEDLLDKTIILRAITIVISTIAGSIFILTAFDEPFILLMSLVIITLYRGFDLLNESFFIFYQAQKRMAKYFVAKIILSFFLVSTFYFIIRIFPSNYILAYSSLAAISLLVFIIQLILYKKNNQINSHRVLSRSTYKYFFKETWPMIANSFFFQVNTRLSILLIGYLCYDSGYLGIYAAAISLVSAITMAGNGLAIVMFSKLVEMFNTNIKGFQILLYKICGGIFIMGFCAALFYYLLTPQFIKMYKLKDVSSVQVFFWCGISIPFILVNTILGYLFTITKKQKTALLISIINLLLSLAILYIFTKQYQIIGASQAYFITNVLSFIILVASLQFIIKTAKTHVKNNTL